MTVPPDVARQHDQAAAARHVPTTAEQDQRNLALALAQDQLLAQLRAARLPSGSAVEKLLDSEIRDARSDHRLAELGTLLGRAISTLGHGHAIGGGPGEDDDIIDGEIVGEDQDDDEVYVYDGGQLVPAMWNAAGQLVPARPQLAITAAPSSVPAARKELTWLDALDVARLPRDNLAPPDRCPIIEAGRTCSKNATEPISERIFICFGHQQFLARIIKRGGRLA